jgi:hypothetical protein
MDELEWMDSIEETNDRKCHLWNRWEQHIEETSTGDWAGPCFSFWCSLILQTPEHFDRMDNGTFQRKDALDVLLAHTRGDIDINKPFPWVWKDNRNWCSNRIKPLH